MESQDGPFRRFQTPCHRREKGDTVKVSVRDLYHPPGGPPRSSPAPDRCVGGRGAASMGTTSALGAWGVWRPAAAEMGGTMAPTVASAPASGDVGGGGSAAAAGGPGEATAGCRRGRLLTCGAAASRPADAASGNAARTGVTAATAGGPPTPRTRHAPFEEAKTSGGGGWRHRRRVTLVQPAAAGHGGSAAVGGSGGWKRGGSGRGGGRGELPAHRPPMELDGQGGARGCGRGRRLVNGRRRRRPVPAAALGPGGGLLNPRGLGGDGGLRGGGDSRRRTTGRPTEV